MVIIPWNCNQVWTARRPTRMNRPTRLAPSSATTAGYRDRIKNRIATTDAIIIPFCFIPLECQRTIPPVAFPQNTFRLCIRMTLINHIVSRWFTPRCNHFFSKPYGRKPVRMQIFSYHPQHSATVAQACGGRGRVTSHRSRKASGRIPCGNQE